MPTQISVIDSGPRELVLGVVVFVVALALSAVLHLGAAAPYVAWTWVGQDLDTPGDGGPDNAPLGDGGGELAVVLVPVQVSLYTAPSTPSPDVRGSAPVAKPAPVEQEDPPRDVPDGAKVPTGTAKQSTANKEGVVGKPPRGKKKPCEPIEEVVKLGDHKWRVERDLLDWYATHLRKLDKQAGVATHRDADGKRDGARLYLPRCSVLKQGGFRNGDIVRSVNGRRVYTIPQAVSTYLSVRKNKTITVELTRKNGKDLTFKYKLK